MYIRTLWITTRILNHHELTKHMANSYDKIMNILSTIESLKRKLVFLEGLTFSK